MKVDLGPPTCKLTDGTEHNSRRAVANVAGQIKALAGRNFFGRSQVELAWEAGQLVEVRSFVEQLERIERMDSRQDHAK